MATGGFMWWGDKIMKYPKRQFQSKSKTEPSEKTEMSVRGMLATVGCASYQIKSSVIKQHRHLTDNSAEITIPTVFTLWHDSQSAVTSQSDVLFGVIQVALLRWHVLANRVTLGKRHYEYFKVVFHLVCRDCVLVWLASTWVIGILWNIHFSKLS